MPTPDVLNFDVLLAPISETSPTGEPLRGGSAALNDVFYEISDARKEARNSERQQSLYLMTQGSENPLPAPKPADWRKVVDLGARIIATQSKDLWIAAWMIEGLCRVEGFAGMRDGFRLVRQLSEMYWDSLHPRSETGEPDVSTLVAQLAGIFDGVMSGPIYDVPVTGSCPRQTTDSTPQYSISQYRQATQLDRGTDPKQRRQQIEKGLVTAEEFSRAVDRTSAESFRNLLDDMEQCLQEFNRMAADLDQRCGMHDAPPTTKTRETLVDCRVRLLSIAKDKLASQEADAAAAEGDATVAKGAAVPAGGFTTREEAFQSLLKVADYFRMHEPHSVVSYSLEQVVRWGRMSLPELLTELIADKKSRQEIFRFTGISDKGTDKGSDSSSE
jgi:type VI secretion system protein ImpA